MGKKNPIDEFKLPLKKDLLEIIENTIQTLKSENSFLRPQDETGLPGALLNLNNNPISSIIVPDLHARVDFFEEILDFKFTPTNNDTKITVKEALEQKKVYVLCVGDGLHSELRGKERWIKAEEQWMEKDSANKYICEEMKEGLDLMTLIMQCKCMYPENFHFLSGNHENILNQFFCGAMPFRKFSSEGEMVKDFMITVYGEEIAQKYADFEHNLPLFIKGNNFLVSHAEPLRPYSEQELIDAFFDDDVIQGLTWTPNDRAQEDSVEIMLKEILPNVKDSIYFAGHRTVQGTHRLLRNNKFIQIHNPTEHFISIIQPDKAFNPLHDIYDTRTGNVATIN